MLILTKLVAAAFACLAVFFGYFAYSLEGLHVPEGLIVRLSLSQLTCVIAAGFCLLIGTIIVIASAFYERRDL